MAAMDEVGECFGQGGENLGKRSDLLNVYSQFFGAIDWKKWIINELSIYH